MHLLTSTLAQDFCGLTSDASRIKRTTIDIDEPILKEIKRLQPREGKSLGRLVSDLLAQSLSTAKAAQEEEQPAFAWIAKPMRARTDLADKHALCASTRKAGARCASGCSARPAWRDDA
jgi:hypothetical protein